MNDRNERSGDPVERKSKKTMKKVTTPIKEAGGTVHRKASKYDTKLHTKLHPANVKMHEKLHPTNVKMHAAADKLKKKTK
jgi:hypothetical protein